MNLHSQSCIPTLHPKTEDIVLMYLKKTLCQFILTNHFHNDIFQKEWKKKKKPAKATCYCCKFKSFISYIFHMKDPYVNNTRMQNKQDQKSNQYQKPRLRKCKT